MKRFTLGILCLVFVCCFAGLLTTKAEAVTTGITGDCTWTLDGSVLTISGNGEMASYYSNGFRTNAPWGYEITRVIFEEGVINIGQYAFYGCSKLEYAYISGSVKRIDTQAFDRSGLKSVTFSEGLTTIYHGAFNSCTSLNSVVLPKSLKHIGDWAFQSCPLTSIVFHRELNYIGQNAFNYVRIADVYYAGNQADEAGITIKGYNACLNTAKWHYEVTDAVANGQDCYYCPECDKYLLADGTEIEPGIFGDFTGDDAVNNEDVIYLLWHTMFPESYPVEAPADFTEDGKVNSEDVIYLLWHTMFPESYPLTEKKKEILA